jgi:hypothetical protein
MFFGVQREPSKPSHPDSAKPTVTAALRRQLGVKNLHLGQALTALEQDRFIDRTPAGWRLSARST